MELQPYEKTPIYRKAREALRSAHVLTARMNKAYKYTLGESIRNAALALTEAVFFAYEEREDFTVKLAHFTRIKNKTQSLLVNYRIANDLQLIPQKEYGEQVEVLISIIRQTRGWEKKVSQTNQA